VAAEKIASSVKFGGQAYEGRSGFGGTWGRSGVGNKTNHGRSTSGSCRQ